MMGPHSYIMMVQSSLPKDVVFSAHVCMHNATYIFPQQQILFPVETADRNPVWDYWVSQKKVPVIFNFFRKSVHHHIDIKAKDLIGC